MQAEHHLHPAACRSGVEQHELATPTGGEEAEAHESRGGPGRHQTPLEVPGVRCVDAVDRAAEGRPLGQGPVALDLGKLGHQPAAASWRARVNTASSMDAVSLPVKVFC